MNKDLRKNFDHAIFHLRALRDAGADFEKVSDMIEELVVMRAGIQRESRRHTCCFCGRHIEGFGNNPAPLKNDEDDRCCDSCNSELVIPARIFGAYAVIL